MARRALSPYVEVWFTTRGWSPHPISTRLSPPSSTVSPPHRPDRGDTLSRLSHLAHRRPLDPPRRPPHPLHLAAESPCERHRAQPLSPHRGDGPQCHGEESHRRHARRQTRLQKGCYFTMCQRPAFQRRKLAIVAGGLHCGHLGATASRHFDATDTASNDA